MSLLAVLLLGALATRVQGVQVPAETSVPSRTHPGSYEGFATNLEGLVARHPELCERLEIGRSRAGRPIWAVRIGARSWPGRAASAPLPAVLVMPALAVDGPAGADAALDLLQQVTEAAAGWEGVSHLSSSVLFVVPAPDPDAWSGAPVRMRRLDRNFPVRWDPWLAEDGSPGPYPLSEPESQALAGFVLARPEIGLVVLLTGPHGDSSTRRPADGHQPGGSLSAFLAEGLATRVLEDRSAVLRDVARGARSDGWALSRIAASLLPRLRAEVTSVERLDRELWQVDVELENTGAIGTGLGPLCAASGRILVTLEGLDLLSLGVSAGHASGAGEEARTTQLLGARSGLALDPLEPRERRGLRLWLQGGEAARGTLHLRTSRTEPTAVELVLR